MSSHLAAFEAPHERKTEMLPRKLCHDDVGKAGIVDTIRPACRIDDAVFSMWPMSNSGLPSAPLLCKCRVRLGSCRCIGLQSRPQLHWRNSSHRYRVGWSGDCCRPGDHGDHAAPTALCDTREKEFASSPFSYVLDPTARLVVTGGRLPKARHIIVAYLSNACQILLKIVN